MDGMKTNWEGEAPAEPKTAANSEVANGKQFDHPHKVGGYKFKAG